MTGHVFDDSILREYDIRGIVGETLGEKDARALGRAFGTTVVEVGGARVALGQDGRLSSPALADELLAGLLETGLEVVRVGVGPTPMLYFAEKYLPTDAAIMVTGSHNPPTHNGFKMVLRGRAIYGGEIRRLGEIAAGDVFAQGKGTVREESILKAYVKRLVADFEPGRPLKVAWDAGNGSAGKAMARLTRKLPGAHILLNETIDGTFPAHHPDPTVPENLEQLRAAVLANGADLGIAFDGDGDRIGVLDGKGRILWGDQLLVFLARDVLRTRPRATVIADVKASQVLFDEVERAGGRPLMWRTGHSLIKAKMAETKALLAGEMSGHIFFADRYYGYDDALYAAVRLLNVVAREDETLAEMRDHLRQVVNTPEIRLPCPDDRKFAVIDEVKTRLERAGADVDSVDGVRVRTADGWWLLRASNTQAALVARCEAASQAGLARLKKQLAAQLAASGLDAAMP